MSVDEKPLALRNDDNDIWGNTWLPVVLEALGKSADEIKGVVLCFEYGKAATATFTHRNDQQTEEVLSIYGPDDSEPLGAPHSLNALTIYIAEENVVTIECRYFPLGASAKDIVAILNDWAEPMVDP